MTFFNMSLNLHFTSVHDGFVRSSDTAKFILYKAAMTWLQQRDSPAVQLQYAVKTVPDLSIKIQTVWGAEETF